MTISAYHISYNALEGVRVDCYIRYMGGWLYKLLLFNAMRPVGLEVRYIV